MDGSRSCLPQTEHTDRARCARAAFFCESSLLRTNHGRVTFWVLKNGPTRGTWGKWGDPFLRGPVPAKRVRKSRLAKCSTNTEHPAVASRTGCARRRILLEQRHRPRLAAHHRADQNNSRGCQTHLRINLRCEIRLLPVRCATVKVAGGGPSFHAYAVINKAKPRRVTAHGAYTRPARRAERDRERRRAHTERHSGAGHTPHTHTQRRSSQRGAQWDKRRTAVG